MIITLLSCMVITGCDGGNCNGVNNSCTTNNTTSTSSGNTQPGTGVTSVQATPNLQATVQAAIQATETAVVQQEPSPTSTPMPSPTPTLVIIHNKQLSQDMLLDNSCGLSFNEPPQDVVVNNKLLQADLSIQAGRCAFKLDTQQKSLQLQCGLGDNEPQGDTYELKVLGDNQELLSEVYTAGGDAIANKVSIQGVQILTFELTGTYYNPAFYCKDQLIY